MEKVLNKDFIVIYNSFYDDAFGGHSTVTVSSYGEDPSECTKELEKTIETWQSHLEKYKKDNSEDGIKMAEGYIEKYKKALDSVRVISVKEYRAEVDKVMLGEPREITEEKYWEMFECLPPLKMGESYFIMSEFFTGSFTSQFFKKNDKYYQQMIDYRRQETWAKL